MSSRGSGAAPKVPAAYAAALSERATSGMLILRGDAGGSAFPAAVAGVLGVAPPTRPNSLAHAGDVTLCWLGPDEWLAILPLAKVAADCSALRQALAGEHAAVVEVTDGFVALVLEHAHAADWLARGCPLDFDESAFPVGSCAQSLFDKSGILLVRESAQRFAVVVRRSFARYLRQAVLDAGRKAFG